MASYIFDNRTALSERHYIRKAGTQEYWFDFSANKLNTYKSRFGLSFCMVLYGSDTEEDAYILPYSEVASLFTEDVLDHRARWIGNIRNNILRLSSGKSLSISAYYNAFDLLDFTQTQKISFVAESDVSYNVEGDIDWDGLRRKIHLFNEQYQNVVPHKRRIVSEQVARPGIVTDYLKQLHNDICQLCGEQGFLQRNGHDTSKPIIFWNCIASFPVPTVPTILSLSARPAIGSYTTPVSTTNSLTMDELRCVSMEWHTTLYGIS